MSQGRIDTLSMERTKARLARVDVAQDTNRHIQDALLGRCHLDQSAEGLRSVRREAARRGVTARPVLWCFRGHRLAPPAASCTLLSRGPAASVQEGDTQVGVGLVKEGVQELRWPRQSPQAHWIPLCPVRSTNMYGRR